jgi:hypothetical protein
MFRVLTAAGLFGTAALAALAPASAQQAPAAGNDQISEIIVYGNDPCPRSTDDDVVVCARKPESERYRIPERLRQGGAIQSRQAWAARARSFEINTRRGINSCDAVGPSGQSGCLQRIIDEARSEQRELIAGDTPPEE